MHVQTTVGPAQEPLSIEECRDQVRVDGTDYDADLVRFLKAARQRAERMTGLRLITQTVQLTADGFGGGYHDRPGVELPVAPIQSVDQVSYLSDEATWTVLDPAEYRLVTTCEPMQLAPAYRKAWPGVFESVQSVRVTATVGFGSAPADVPEDIRQAVALLLGHYFAHREAVVAGITAAPLPLGVSDMLFPHKRWL
jgi:uncharacterized phiE125 gp8 family phage protein